LYPKNFQNVFDPLRTAQGDTDVEVMNSLAQLRARRRKSRSEVDGRPMTFHLGPSDDEVLASSNIGLHFNRFRLALLKTAKEVEASVKAAEATGRNLVLLK
jgi:hypothetical protein